MEEKDEYALEAEARMKAPLEWYSSAKCKILDLKEPQYDKALRLIKVQLQDHGVAVLPHSARSCKLLSTSTAPLLSRGVHVQGILVAGGRSVRKRLPGARKNVVEGNNEPGRHQP